MRRALSEAERNRSLAVPCPVCFSPVGERCTQATETGRRPVEWVHLSRVESGQLRYLEEQARDAEQEPDEGPDKPNPLGKALREWVDETRYRYRVLGIRRPVHALLDELEELLETL